jgi:electron transport complex protein RnfG
MLRKLIYFWKESWLLMVSSVIFGLILAATESAWGPRIAENQVRLFNKQAGQLLPEATAFEAVTEEILIQPEQGTPQQADIRKALKENTPVGWVFIVEGAGFADKIRLVVAVDAAFEKLKGFSVLASSETPGFGDKIKIKDGFYQSQYNGAPVGEFTLVKTGNPQQIDNEIVAITGATVTSQAVVDMMNAYVAPIREQLAQKGLLP